MRSLRACRASTSPMVPRYVLKIRYAQRQKIREARNSSLLSIILWNPLHEPEVTLQCPVHKDEELQTTGLWTHMGKLKSRTPRRLYHVGENVLLVSAIYQCRTCGGDMEHDTLMAHHPDILHQLSKVNTPPFHLFNKAGLTREAYEFIINFALAGTSFCEIQESFGTSMFG